MKSRLLIRLKTQMLHAGLTLRDVAEESGVNYTVASAVLNGVRIQPEALEKIEAAIRKLSEATAR